MRILKYLFLLLFLLLTGLTVFVVTQKGDYSIRRTQLIDMPRNEVYNYLNNYQNWEFFASWADAEGKTQFSYPKNTSGKNASFSWHGAEDGFLKTTAATPNKSIEQIMNLNGTETRGTWLLKDTLGKTQVTWKTEGTLSVGMKIKAFLNGGIDAVIGDTYEKTLVNLSKSIVHELKTNTIKVEGEVMQPETWYIGQTIVSRPDKVQKNIRILIPKLIRFFEKNNMVMKGKPFVIYNTIDDAKKITDLTVCIGVRDSVYIMAGSEVESGKIPAHKTLKVSLKGDYRHLPKANQKALDYLFEKQIKRNFEVKPYVIYTRNPEDTKHPSEWKTELMYPVFYKPQPKPRTVSVATRPAVVNDTVH